ncbi:Hypothetical predicted protein [Marmota monax]|uniref:Uncharacterized protein n=1 Tax=Marmota monax TaxID=9995 RepID=A0A5E4C7V9_MARMO|nr:Hypothetical predicted protein [Marmota monax]
MARRSSPRVAVVSCFNSALDGTRRWTPYHCRPLGASSLRPPLHRPSQASAAAPGPRLSSAATATTTSPSQARQNYHQDLEAAINHQINLEL